MMENRAPAVHERKALALQGTHVDPVLFELSVEAGHGNGTSGKIYGSVDRDSTEDLPIIG